ncbi:M90 family metallopeptidase [Kangiella sediminilitoris]
MLPLYIFLFVCAGLIVWIATSNYRKRKKRQLISSEPFPKEWRQILRKNLSFFYKIPSDLQLQLKDKMKIFLSEKEFIGHQGQEITEEVRVTIAAQACLLLLNRPTDFYPFLKTISVYPAAFITNRATQDSSGVHQRDSRVLLGESWNRGKVILSWQDSAQGAADFEDGHNLVIHEFAHQLDGESGVTNGAPPLTQEQDYDTWSQVLSSEFEDLRQQAQKGERTLIDHYGATNPAEFFAVASEVFFEKPAELKKRHSKLYAQLQKYYSVDPSAWV